MFATIAAPRSQPSSSPAPSPTPSPVPADRACRYQRSRQRIGCARGRTTYVVTAADIARDGDRTIADALAERSGRQHLAIRCVRRPDERRHTRQFGAASPRAARRASDRRRPDREREPRATGGRRRRARRDRRRRRIDALRLRLDRRRHQHHHRTAAHRHPRRWQRDRSTSKPISCRRPIFRFSVRMPPTPTHCRAAPIAHNADAGLTTATATYSHPLGAFDLDSLANVERRRLRRSRVRSATSSPTSREQTIARDFRLRLEEHSARATFAVALGDSTQDLAFTCDTPADSNCPNSYTDADRRRPPRRHTPSRSTTSGAMVEREQRRRRCAPAPRLRHRPIARNARIDGGTGSGARRTRCGESAYQSSIVPPHTRRRRPTCNRNGSVERQRVLCRTARRTRTNTQSNAAGGAISPSLGGIVPLGPTLQLRLNAATAFRAPDRRRALLSARSFFRIRSSFRNERASATQRWSTSTSSAAVEFGWFTTTRIEPDRRCRPAAYDYVPENIGRASIQGFTLDAKTLPFHGLVATLA